MVEAASQPPTVSPVTHAPDGCQSPTSVPPQGAFGAEQSTVLPPTPVTIQRTTKPVKCDTGAETMPPDVVASMSTQLEPSSHEITTFAFAGGVPPAGRVSVAGVLNVVPSGPKS